MRRVLLVSLLVAALLLSMPPLAAPVAASGDNTVSGTVLDSEGVPAEGATVTALKADTGVAKENTTAGSGGNYSMNVSTGNYDFTFSYANHSLKTLYNVSVEADVSEQNVTLQEPDRFNLTGKVESGYGSGLAGVEVSLSPAVDPFPSLEAVTEGDGVFVFEDVRGGVYNISMERDGYIQWIVPEHVVVDGDKTLAQALSMAPAFGSVEGQVYSEGLPGGINDAQVILLDKDGVELQRTKSDGSGDYAFEENIPTGEYVLRVERSGYDAEEKSIRVEAFETHVVDFKLDRTERPDYLFAQDLPHTLMVAGLLLSLLFLAAALRLRRKVAEDPSILYVPEEEDEEL